MNFSIAAHYLNSSGTYSYALICYIMYFILLLQLWKLFNNSRLLSHLSRNWKCLWKLSKRLTRLVKRLVFTAALCLLLMKINSSSAFQTGILVVILQNFCCCRLQEFLWEKYQLIYKKPTQSQSKYFVPKDENEKLNQSVNFSAKPKQTQNSLDKNWNKQKLVSKLSKN